MQRIAFRTDYWNDTGPLYLYIGGPDTLDNHLGILYSGLMHDMAQETKGVMLVVEHRYYGDSVPNKLVRNKLGYAKLKLR